MTLPQPIGVARIPGRNKYPNSFVVPYKGHTMDSAHAEKRVRNGDYLLLHPITLKESIGKVVALSLPDSLTVWQVVRVSRAYVTVRIFNPYIADMKIPLSKVEAVYSVDEVLEEITLLRRERRRLLERQYG